MNAKPCRLELNNSGAWKLLGKFDAGREDTTDAIMNAAAELAQALNDPASGRTAHTSLRISTDDLLPITLMRWEPKRPIWVDAATREPA